jgi:hypothetical protein
MIHLTKVSFDDDVLDKYKGVPKVDRRVLEHGIKTMSGPMPSNEAMKALHSPAPISSAPGTIQLDPPHPYKISSTGSVQAYSTHSYAGSSVSIGDKHILEGKFQGFRF